ncbi:MAG: ABC transporter ATP-binding protein [Rhodospirillales bacterium]
MSVALSQNAVEIRGLSKTYAADAGQSPKVALKDINLDIPTGSFFGLLGPNGAGKSTLINTLAGLVLKTSGSAKICGYDIETEMRQARTAIGVVPQELNIDPFFTPRELLELQAGLYGVPKKDRLTNEILNAVGLQDKCDAYPRTLSGGMRRRLLVAKAMVHRPRVLVLDEPSAGVDIDLRRQLWVHVKELNAQGTTVLLTTHYLEEAEALCDRIAIINHGALIACDSTSALLQRLDAKQMMITVDQDVPILPDALSSFNVEQKSSRQLIFRYSPSKTNSGEILTAVQNAKLGILDLATKEVELEDIFLHLTGGEETEEL